MSILYNQYYSIDTKNNSQQLVNIISSHIHFSDYRCQNELVKRKTIPIDFTFNSAIVSLGSWSIQFGRKELDQSKMSKLSIQFGIESYEDDKLTLISSVILRDLAGDTSWSADIGLNILFFN